MSNLHRIRNTAFAKWLLRQPREVAIAHLFECLRTGESGNAAWELWEAVHGDLDFAPDEMTTAVGAMLDSLKDAA